MEIARRSGEWRPPELRYRAGVFIGALPIVLFAGASSVTTAGGLSPDDFALTDQP